MSNRAVIVGGGLGGLATALRLRAACWTVTVCEQGERMGGKMNYQERDGFRFDTGPSLITMPWIFEDLFRAVGHRLDERLELVPVRPIAEYVFPDGTRFAYSASLPEWLETVRQIEPRDVDGFLRFLELGARLFQLSKATFFRRSPLEPPDAEALRALRHLPFRRGWGNYHRMVEAHFRSPLLRQLFDRYPTYVGSSPYRAPATLAVIPYIEYVFGGWHIRGGLYRLVEQLVALARETRIDLRTSARVARIERDAKRVRGVTLANGTRLDADVVVMNGDVSTTPELLGDEPRPLPVDERSLSGVVMLLGVARRLPELAHHTVYFSADYQGEFGQLFDDRSFPDDPTVYVCAPSRTDPTVAADGGETLFVMANAPATGDWSDARKEEVRGRILARLAASGFPDVTRDVAVSDVWTPKRIAERYSMPGGAIYGTHSHGWRHAFLRPSNRDRRIGGLYYVGGSSHPGGGTPTVLLSAEIVCRLVERYER